MSDDLLLLPRPRNLTRAGDDFTLTDQMLILLDSPTPRALRSAAARFQRALSEYAGFTWEVVASAATPTSLLGLTLRIAPRGAPRPQGYELSLTPDGLLVEAHDEAGIFYGVCTLIQIVQQCGRQLPCLRISDWPDFPARGVMLDVSRDKVPAMDTLFALVDVLAGWKINQLQLYTEHTFAYRNHPEVWAKASPFTGQEILELDAYCRERFVELVPNQNSFGHMERWLTHPRYAPLAETTGRFRLPWGEEREGPFGLCPLDPGCLELLHGLYDELLPHFSSRMFNVGCDETFDLGQGRSKDECVRRGTGRVYLHFLLKIYGAVRARGRTMQFWGDIVRQHPELVPELPKEVVALEWGYESNHPFDAHGARFAAAGIPYYVCPGTSSWCSIAGRTDNVLANLLNAAENGLKHGAVGYLNTDWGDGGHWQYLLASYTGFAGGAAYSWALESNRGTDIARAASAYAFRDPTGAMGRAAFDLGNVYRAIGLEPPNSSALFWILRWPLELVRGYRDTVPPDVLRHTLDTIDRAMAPLAGANSQRPDAALLHREFAMTARLLKHACRRALFAYEPDPALAAALEGDMREAAEEYRALWLARNRPGGLEDSIAPLEKVRADYGG